MRATRKRLAPCDGPDAAGGFGDAGGGAEDEDLAGWLVLGVLLAGWAGWAHRWSVSGDALPEAGGEEGVAVAGELLPLGVEGLELRGGHGGVFGGVEAAAELEGHVGEALEEGEALVGLDGEVEGEGDAGLGEAHHAGRGDVAEGFEDGEEAGEAGLGDLVQDGDGSLAGVLPGDDVLELEEAALAVHAVPVEDLVERVEEGLVVLQGDDALVNLLVEEGGVEEADGELVEGEAGGFEGEDELWVRVRA